MKKKKDIDTKLSERLNQLIKWSGLTANAFSKSIGMPSPSSIYMVLKGKLNVSPDMASFIVSTYPSISYNWLMKGIGDMKIQKSEQNLEKNAKSKQKSKHKIDNDCFDFAVFENFDVMIKVFDNAMYPLIPAGCAAIARELSTDVIIYGNIYLIVMGDISVIRIIRKSTLSKDFLTLVSIDKLNYDTITINRSAITNLYLVKGILNSF